LLCLLPRRPPPPALDALALPAPAPPPARGPCSACPRACPPS